MSFPSGSDGKDLPIMQQTQVQSLGWEIPLEKEMAPHPSILAWRIPMDRGAWWATVHGVAKSWTWLRDFYFISSTFWQRKKLGYKEYRWQSPQIGSASGRFSLPLLTGKFCEWVVAGGVCVWVGVGRGGGVWVGSGDWLQKPSLKVLLVITASLRSAWPFLEKS